jgi:GT2 family glycosyltransferase
MPERGLGEARRGQPSILAVIVLYRTRPSESAAFTTLVAQLERTQRPDCQFQVLLYDNACGDQFYKDLPPYVVYHAAACNEGIAGAYNYALRFARREGFSWMFTLDQDTQLPMDCLTQMRELALRLEGNGEVGAIIPQLSHGGRLLSPFRIRPWGVSYLPRGFTGLAQGEVHALNSASLFRVRTLSEIGGFDPRFWLDYQDYYVFRQLHRHGRQVWVAGGIQVEHNLSLLSENRSPAPDRFRNFLQAESVFCDLYRGHIDGLALTGRLACRLWRQRRENVDSAMRQLTLNALKRRLFLNRTRRICDWESEMQQRMVCPPKQDSLQRPSISVCMATYNGARFLKQQIDSILPQLDLNDELVVVDDASTDNTWKLLCDIQDQRIRLFRNEKNRGAIPTFEYAVSQAIGDYLFLSDQDDIWLQGRVKQILAVFEKDSSITLVMTNALRIDEYGRSLGARNFSNDRPARLGLLHTLIRNSYQGSLMTFRRDILKVALPFPKGIPMHDSWIGMVNCIAGKTYYLDKELLYYRRHDANVTKDKHASIWKMTRDRWILLTSFVRRYPQLLSTRWS